MDYTQILKAAAVIVMVAAIIILVLRNIASGQALHKIASGNFIAKLSFDRVVNRKFKKVVERLVLWVYNMLKFSVNIAHQLKQIQGSCSESLNTAKIMEDKFRGFEKESDGMQKQIEILQQRMNGYSASQEEMQARTEETVLAAGKTGEAIGSGRNAVNDSIGLLAEMNSQIELLAGNMDKLSGITSAVDNMVKAIDKISSEINLLSLNASIEAARAGKAGVGFAVVAAEIGNLSRKSAEATKNTEGSLEEIRNNIDDVAATIAAISNMREKTHESTNTLEFHFAQISGEVEGITGLVNEVSQKVASNMADSHEIIDSFDQISSFFHQFSSGIKGLYSGIERQYHLEQQNITSADGLLLSAREMLEFTKQFEDIISEKLISSCQELNRRIAANKISNENVDEFCREFGISEINITDSDGTICISNSKGNLGFVFTETDTGQAGTFARILKDASQTIQQSFEMRSLDDKCFKYIGISRKDKPGVVQAGIDLEDLTRLKI